MSPMGACSARTAMGPQYFPRLDLLQASLVEEQVRSSKVAQATAALQATERAVGSDETIIESYRIMWRF